MKTYRPFPVLFFLALFAFSLVASAGDLSEEPFFQKVKGSWVGDGDVSGPEGTAMEIREEWEGKVNDDGSFTMEGVRNSPQDDQQEFRWTFLFNTATESYEASYWQDGMEEEIRLEVVVAENSATCRTALGDGGAEIQVIYRLEKGKLVGEVRITDTQGLERLSADMLHERAEVG